VPTNAVREILGNQRRRNGVAVPVHGGHEAVELPQHGDERERAGEGRDPEKSSEHGQALMLGAGAAVGTSATMRGMSTHRDLVAQGFSETASDYDGAVRYNIEGAQRLVMAIPPGTYNDVLDVGCGAQPYRPMFPACEWTGLDARPVGDIEADMARIKAFYAPFKGKNPQQFATD
jgi:hypothetical protein